MITVAGICIGIFLARIAGPRERWLRLAVLAQMADLVTFAVIWEHAQGELNPLGGLVRGAILAALGPTGDGPAVYGAALVLGLMKLGLIGFLLRIAPLLGRYRTIVLVVAAAAGTVGAASNVLAYPNAAVSLAVVALFALVAIRWPARYGVAVRTGAGMAASGLLGIGGVAALSYSTSASTPYLLCGGPTCSPMLPGLLLALAIALFAAGVIGLAMTVRFAAVGFRPARIAA